MRSSLVVPALLLAFSPGLAAADPEPRNWTDQKGRPLRAAFGGTEDNQVILILSTGAEARVPLATLSAADQEWVAEQTQPSAPDPAAPGNPDEGYDGPEAEISWPSTVALEEKGDASVIEEDEEKRIYRYESEHYEFVCDAPIGLATVREFSKVFEATWLVNCVLPLDLKPRPERLRNKFLARIFSTEEDYMQAGGVPGSAGVYISSEKALMLPLESLGVKMVGKRVSVDYGSEDYRTLVHEITHQMMNRWLGPLPTWYIEGSAEYVELADYSNGRFKFSQHHNRLEDHLGRYGPEFPLVPVETLMNITPAEWSSALTEGGASANYASALALTYFFYHIDGDGEGTEFFQYLRGVESLERATVEALKVLEDEHLLRGRTYAELEEELRKGLRKLGVKCADPV